MKYTKAIMNGWNWHLISMVPGNKKTIFVLLNLKFMKKIEMGQSVQVSVTQLYIIYINLYVCVWIYIFLRFWSRWSLIFLEYGRNVYCVVLNSLKLISTTILFYSKYAVVVVSYVEALLGEKPKELMVNMAKMQ